MAGAAFRDILGDSRSGNRCIFQYKIVSEIGRVRSPKRRVRDDNFMFVLSSDHGRIVFILAEAIQGFLAQILNSQAQYLLSLKGDFTCLAQGVNDASYARRINHEESVCAPGIILGEVGG